MRDDDWVIGSYFHLPIRITVRRSDSCYPEGWKLRTTTTSSSISTSHYELRKMLIQYEEQIVSDLLSDPAGGVVVLASGLRLQAIISSVLSIHATGTLLILTSSLPPSDSLTSIEPRPSEIPGDLLSHHRATLYSSEGKSFFITPRILIADLLTGRCRPSDVSKIIMLDAHRLSETSTEAFIVRVLRKGNRKVSVWAFSDRPQAMVAGFAKAERVLKCLGVRKLHLWPRFQVQVSADLERYPPEVVDIRVPMTLTMKAVQNAVLSAMDACLKELRRTNKVDVDDLTVENGLFKSFDEIVKRQLDPIWHTLGRKTKQLVADLRTLRKLADYLVRYDAVTYLKYLDTLRASEGARSVWILADSSHKIFEVAKRRVYQVLSLDGTTNSKNTGTKKRKLKEDKNTKEHGTKASFSTQTNQEAVGVMLEEVLEEAPKWKALRELLEEVEEERQNQRCLMEDATEDLDDDNDIVLVACKDEHSCMLLEECIVKGPKQVMREEWEKYLLCKMEFLSLKKQKKQKVRETKGFGVLNGEIPIKGDNSGTSSISTLENDALLEAASGISRLVAEEYLTVFDPEPSAGKMNNVRRKRKSKNKINVQVSGEKCETEPVEKCKHESPCMGNKDEVTELYTVEGTHSNVPFLRKHTTEHGESDLYSAKSIPPVQFYAIDSGKNILHVMKPSIIIVYHPHVTFVREIEIYKAENHSKALKVYFLFYEDSTEVQKFEASIRKENSAFESLIRQKSLMMIPVDQESRCTSFVGSDQTECSILQNSSTRKAGGRKVLEKEMQVIVDMREFKSSLPNVLHQKGMHIIPVVLEVGDYVLSPSICVERKSIPDLFQSFASGRLYHQVEMMSRYYTIPVLLIEFSQDRSFSFQSACEIGDDVSQTNIVSKLSLLVLHFPRLRLIWSRSLHATAEIFSSLKTNQDEPDEVKATRVGVPSEDGVIENDVRAENYNTSAVEFLRRLPGVTDANYRALMDGCNSLADLSLLPVEKLAELMGGQKAARTLRDFLDAKYPTML